MNISHYCMTACDSQHFVLWLLEACLSVSNNFNMLDAELLRQEKKLFVCTRVYLCVSQVAAFHIRGDIYVNYKDQHYIQTQWHIVQSLFFWACVGGTTLENRIIHNWLLNIHMKKKSTRLYVTLSSQVTIYQANYNKANAFYKATIWKKDTGIK